ncbi:MAG: SRPBCC domain-containing protein [Thermoplasmatales archaeon]
MELSGEFDVTPPKDVVLSYLKNINNVVSTIPEVVSSELIDSRTAKITLKAGISAIKGKFVTTLQINDQGEVVNITAKGSGSSGSIDLNAKFSPEDANGITKIKWNVQISIGGMVATMGSRVIDSAVQKYIKALTDSFRSKIEAK